jgi:hypothetical protein
MVFVNGNEKVEKLGGQKGINVHGTSECIPIPAPYFNPNRLLSVKNIFVKKLKFLLYRFDASILLDLNGLLLFWSLHLNGDLLNLEKKRIRLDTN